MTHISDLHDYSPEPTQVAKDFIAASRKKQIKYVIEQLIEDEFDRLEEYADNFISQTAASRAEQFLERVLAGDEDAARELLGGEHDRYRTGGYNDGKPWMHLIHGRLFETGGVAMRRAIVEAHAELLKSERIADLEATVEGLSQQIRELDRDLERCRERL